MPALRRGCDGASLAAAAGGTQLVAAPELQAATLGLSSRPTIDFTLVYYFVGWALGSYYFTISNKLALRAAGGVDGFPITIGFVQMLLGSCYAIYLWIAPDARPIPRTTLHDLMQIAPVAACAAGAHVAYILSMNLGAASFAHIVKAVEPAFAALLGVTLYGRVVSRAQWLCLVPVIGGVCLASLHELNFSLLAFLAACAANLFGAFRANENKKLLETAGLSSRIGSVGNQFALSTMLGTLALAPLFAVTEARRVRTFVSLVRHSAPLRSHLLTSALSMYLYNELSTLFVAKTSATTQSVANTAKRAFVIVGVATALGEGLEPIKLLGCAISIGGVLLYSLAA